MTTSEVLNKAADLIEERGWTTQGQANDEGHGDPWGRNDHAPLCIEGAIMAAAGLSHNFKVQACPAGMAVLAHLGERIGVRRLWLWNDVQATGASEVIEVLRATAVIEAAKENAETRELADPAGGAE